jgi:hypothetical protein
VIQADHPQRKGRVQLPSAGPLSVIENEDIQRKKLALKVNIFQVGGGIMWDNVQSGR